MHEIVFDILGLRDDSIADNQNLVSGLVDMILNIRLDAKSKKDWATSDKIRNELQNMGVVVKDRKDGYDWELE